MLVGGCGCGVHDVSCPAQALADNTTTQLQEARVEAAASMKQAEGLETQLKSADSEKARMVVELLEAARAQQSAEALQSQLEDARKSARVAKQELLQRESECSTLRASARSAHEEAAAELREQKLETESCKRRVAELEASLEAAEASAYSANAAASTASDRADAALVQVSLFSL